MGKASAMPLFKVEQDPKNYNNIPLPPAPSTLAKPEIICIAKLIDGTFEVCGKP